MSTIKQQIETTKAVIKEIENYRSQGIKYKLCDAGRNFGGNGSCDHCPINDNSGNKQCGDTYTKPAQRLMALYDFLDESKDLQLVEDNKRKETLIKKYQKDLKEYSISLTVSRKLVEEYQKQYKEDQELIESLKEQVKNPDLFKFNEDLKRIPLDIVASICKSDNYVIFVNEETIRNPTPEQILQFVHTKRKDVISFGHEKYKGNLFTITPNSISCTWSIKSKTK